MIGAAPQGAAFFLCRRGGAGEAGRWKRSAVVPQGSVFISQRDFAVPRGPATLFGNVLTFHPPGATFKPALPDIPGSRLNSLSRNGG